MTFYEYLDGILKQIDAINNYTNYVKKTCPTVSRKPKTTGYHCPDVSRVIFNNDATIVIFNDGTKSSVIRDKNDSYDRTTAVVYAIVKRMFATAINKGGYVNSSYITTIHNLVDNAYDQQLEEENNAKKKAEAQAKHEAKQKHDQDLAFERRVKDRVKELRVEAAARAILEGKKPSVLNECTCNKAPSKQTSNDILKHYTKPNKPFSKFTQQEKREYWRAHSAKNRSEKNDK